MVPHLHLFYISNHHNSSFAQVSSLPPAEPPSCVQLLSLPERRSLVAKGANTRREITPSALRRLRVGQCGSVDLISDQRLHAATYACRYPSHSTAHELLRFTQPDYTVLLSVQTSSQAHSFSSLLSTTNRRYPPHTFTNRWRPSYLSHRCPMSPISSALSVPPFTPEPWVRGRLPNMSLSFTTPHQHRLQEIALATLILGPVEPRRTKPRLSFHVTAPAQDRPTRLLTAVARVEHGCLPTLAQRSPLDGFLMPAPEYSFCSKGG